MKNNLPTSLISRFKGFYRDLNRADFNELEDLYDKEVLFQDPVHQVRGRVQLQDYMSNLCVQLTECRFEYLDELILERSAYIKWVMHFRHRKLGNRLVSVRGISHIQFSNAIIFHEDIYDMGAMLYEQLPVMGSITRWLKQRIAR